MYSAHQDIFSQYLGLFHMFDSRTMAFAPEAASTSTNGKSNTVQSGGTILTHSSTHFRHDLARG